MHRGPRGDHPTTPVPVIVGDFAARKKTRQAASLSVGAGRGSPGDWGVTGGAFTPGQSSSGPLSNLPKPGRLAPVRSEE
jgi:hypothetical protein